MILCALIVCIGCGRACEDGESGEGGADILCIIGKMEGFLFSADTRDV